MEFKIKIADKIVQITSQYSYLKTFCKDYLVEENEETSLSIHLSKDEIEAENDETSEYEYTNEYLETLATLRKLGELFPTYQRFLMHGACISFNNKGYFFTAPSGTGKSTHISLWKRYLKEHVDIVNGDKPFLSIENKEGIDKVMIYGTPWAGKEGWNKNCKVELGAICIVARGKENKCVKIKPCEYLTFLMKQVYIPKNPNATISVLDLFDRLLKTVPIYYLECDISEDAVKCSFEAMTQHSYEEYKQ